MRRILVVDDDPTLNECMLEMLSELGYETKGALSGAECLALLDSPERRPDLILLDIMMEPMDGWETLRGIRERPACRGIPVIMVTGKVPTAKELNEFVSMINGYLIKPFAMQYLGTEIEKISWCVKKKAETIDHAHSSAEDMSIVEEFFRLLCTVHILEHLSATPAKGSIDQAALARDKHRLESLRQLLSSMRA